MSGNGNVIHGNVSDATAQMNEMSRAIAQGEGAARNKETSKTVPISELPDAKEKKIHCVCGRTDSTGCLRPRCDFPGWHG